MKILPNIIPLIKIKNSLKFPDKYKADIEKYRREGNAEKEREFILKASSVWGKNIIDIFSIDLTVNGRENLPEKVPLSMYQTTRVTVTFLYAALRLIKFNLDL